MLALGRRRVLGAAASAAVGVLATPAIAQSRAGNPIRIGLITPLTGQQEVLGRPILTGALIAADQINATGGVLGRPIEIVPADGAADPAIAEAAGRALIADRIELFCGALRSEVAFALWPLMRPAGAAMIACGAMSEALTHEMFDPNCFRVCDHTFMRGRAQAMLLAQRFPDVVAWSAVIPDIAFGHSAYAAFREGLEYAFKTVNHASVHVADPIVTRFGQTDFRGEAAAIAKGDMKGLFVGVYGGDAIDFYRQARLAGATDNISVLADSINEYLVPMELGSDVPDDLWLGVHWYYGGYRNNALGRQLYADNLAHTGEPMPLGFLNEGHSAVYAYAAAIRKAGSARGEAVVAALPGLSFETAKGRVTFRREDHQAICDINFVQIKQMDGEPGFEVEQFVRYDGADFIEPPTPGRAILPL